MKRLIIQPGQSAIGRPGVKEPAAEGLAQAKATMDDFWIKHGWYKPMKDGSKKLTYADWCMGEGIRQDAVRFLVEKVLRKDPRDITYEDFESNRLGGLLTSYYKDSPYAALTEAGYDFRPWEMLKTPKGFYESKDIRIAAVTWLVQKLGKDPRDITAEDFCSNRLCGLINNYNNHSPYDALTEAGYVFHPWEMAKTPQNIYDSEKNRVAATTWLVRKLGKDPRDITQEDFYANRLCGLLTDHYSGSPYDALKDAGYAFHPWEMSVTPRGFYESKKNRVAAITWLVKKLSKESRDMTLEDFRSNRLGGLLSNYYSDIPYYALKEAGYNLHPWEMLKTPQTFYESKDIRIAAINWLVQRVKKSGKEPRDITQEEFRSNRLGGLLYNYYNGSPYDALLEAGLISKKDEAYMRSSQHTHGDSR